MAKVLVTGGAGFIGSHLVDRLVDLGHQVVIVDNLSTGSIANVNRWSQLYKMSIEDPKLEEVFHNERPDYVFHLAAQVSLGYSFENMVLDGNSNIIGSINILENCKKYKVKKIIFSSTAAVYGEHEELPVKENAGLKIKSPYGISKATVETYLHLFKEKSDLDFVVLRYANVYGPRQTLHGETGVIAIFVDQITRGQQPVIFGDGNQTRDFVYVSDVVAANVAAMQDEVIGTYNVSTGRETSVNEIFDLLREASGTHYDKIYSDTVDAGVSRSSLCNEKICHYLGFTPTVSLKEGLKKTYEYYRGIRLNEGVWIIMAAYNESQRIGQVLKALNAITHNIVVVDDFSKDNTAEVALQYKCHVIRHPVNYGQGAALQAGMDYAIKNGAKVLVHFDGDGQMQIKDIEGMVSPILSGEVDVTFGSRALGKQNRVPFTKKWFIHKPSVLLNWSLTGMMMTDAHCGFRALSAEAAKKCVFKQNRMAHATEILDLVKNAGVRYKEVPVDIVYHHYGQKFAKGFKIIRDLLLAKLLRS